MSEYSLFISKRSYENYYAPNNPNESIQTIGRADEQGDRWICCMSSEEANDLIAKHTREDSSLDTGKIEEDIGLREGTFDRGVYRADFETDGEVRATQTGGVNDNGQCTGDGKLPGGDSDLEAKNVPRENIVNIGEVKGSKQSSQNTEQSTKARGSIAQSVSDKQSSASGKTAESSPIQTKDIGMSQ